MLGIIAFIISIISVALSFFQNLLVLSFITAIAAIILAILSAYDKDVTKKEEESKDSRALEIGSIIIAAASILSYFVFTIIA